MITAGAELAPIDQAGVPAGHTDADRSVSEATRRRIIDAVPANTTRAYGRQWAAFITWCAAVGRAALPATAETLAEYVGHLADAGRAPATIEQAVAAIRTAHRAAGHREQPDTEGARLVLRGHRRARAAGGRRARQATPVTIESLRAMVEHCDPDTVIGLRDRVALVLGLALMGRRSELVALERDDVTETPDGLEVLIRASKTDQDALGAVVAIPPGQHADTDPVRLVRAWRARLVEHGITSGSGISGAGPSSAVSLVAPRTVRGARRPRSQPMIAAADDDRERHPEQGQRQKRPAREGDQGGCARARVPTRTTAWTTIATTAGASPAKTAMTAVLSPNAT